MLKVSVTVNPNKDKNLVNTCRMLDILAEYDCKVYMSDTFLKPYGDQPPVAQTFLKDRNVEYLPEYQLCRRAQLCIVFGGDGTILKIAKKAASGGAYILGINLGRVGYIAELETSELELIRKVLALSDISDAENTEGIHVDKRMMLKAEIIHNGNTVFYSTALNDIVVSKGAVSRMAFLKLSCDGKTISTYRADGIIVSTPTGSTAYCMSAGGPIIDPKLECLCAIPVCPYMCVNSGAVVFSPDSVIEIEFTADKINEAFCTIDGMGVKSITSGDTVRISRSSLSTKLIRLKDADFYGVLNEKMALVKQQ